MPIITGTVYDDAGAPAVGRIVRAYRRDTGALIQEQTTSDGTLIPGMAGVVSLLHFDGADGSTTFTDEAGKVWTPVGTAQIDTAQSRFGGACGYFDGASDYISTPDDADFELGSANFTIQGSLRRETGGPTIQTIIAKRADTDQWAAFAVYVSSGALRATFSTSGSSYALDISGGTINLDQWYDFAVVRQGTTVKGYLGDTEVFSGALSGSIYNNASPVFIGGEPMGSVDRSFKGHLDEMRITNGTAQTIAVLTEPFPSTPLSVGKYEITTDYIGEHQIVFLDDDAGTLYNDIIHRVITT